MKIIQLTREQVAQVDDEDFEYLNQFNWWVTKKKSGYYAFRQEGRNVIYMARQIMNAQKGDYVDHRNHNTLDNQKYNLRICTHSQNLQNMKIRSGCSSRYKGVDFYKNRKKWRGKIKVGCKYVFLGLFEREDDAALAYNEAADKYFGEFAKLNIIGC